MLNVISESRRLYYDCDNAFGLVRSVNQLILCGDNYDRIHFTTLVDLLKKCIMLSKVCFKGIIVQLDDLWSSIQVGGCSVPKRK